jgi:hypothetical protein
LFEQKRNEWEPKEIFLRLSNTETVQSYTALQKGFALPTLLVFFIRPRKFNYEVSACFFENTY